jgi:hypothetical protein
MDMTEHPEDVLRRFARQKETIRLALASDYRDQEGPSETLMCPLCKGVSGFLLRPDGVIICAEDDCDHVFGRWAAA